MKLKGKTLCDRLSGKELGVCTKATSKHVWIGEKRYPRDVVIFVKKSKRPRKGKAPDEDRLRKQQIKEDKDIKLQQDEYLKDIPEFLRREKTLIKNTEKNIQFKSYGCRANSKMWHTSSRYFPNVEQAQKYLKEFIGDQELDLRHDKRKRFVKLPSDSGISCNYRLDWVLKGKAPKGLLPNIFSLDDKKIRSPRMPSSTSSTTTRSTSTMSKNKSQDLIVLKQLCRDLGDLDPRKSRILLRKKLGNTSGRWAWEKGSKELAEVTAVLKGEDPKAEKKPKKKSDPKRSKKSKK